MFGRYKAIGGPRKGINGKASVSTRDLSRNARRLIPSGDILRKRGDVLKVSVYFLPALLVGQTTPSADGLAYFETNIRPLLAANCYACHSSKLPKPMGGLLLDSRAG